MAAGLVVLVERVAVVGSRVGADLEAVERFVTALYAKQPESILVSGGAKGVDTLAEQTWLKLGGRVLSLRPIQVALEEYAIQTWELGGDSPRCFIDANELTWKDYASACHYRDILIADRSDRLVAFYRKGRSRGTAFTAEIMREAYERPVYEFDHTPEEVFAA